MPRTTPLLSSNAAKRVSISTRSSRSTPTVCSKQPARRTAGARRVVRWARSTVLLYHSGWRIDRILRVCLQNLGRLPNAPSAASPTPSLAPEYKKFAKAVRLLRDLQVKGQLQLIGQMSVDEESVEAIVLQIDPQADVQDLMTLLELPPDTN